MSDQSEPAIPHGVVIWQATAGVMRAGDPLQESAYRTLGYPEGIRASHLQALVPDEQAETICSWVHANYQPLPTNRIGMHIPLGSAPAAVLLGGTFGGILIPLVIAAAVGELDEQSALWEPTAQNSWNDARPLSRGVEWRPLRYGTATYGKPYHERAYVTPIYPNGITDGELNRLLPNEQANLGRFWFLSNYEPFVRSGVLDEPFSDGTRFTDGTGFIDQDFALPRAPAREILRGEFAAVIRFGVRRRLVNEMDAISAEWVEIQDRPAVSQTGVQQSQMNIIDRLDRLERTVVRINEASGNIGHNGGPPLLNDREVALVTEAIAQTRVGLSAASNGRADLEEAQDKLSQVEKSLSRISLEGFVKGASEGAGKWAIITLLGACSATALWHALHEAIAAIEHILSTMPPPAFL